MQPAEQNRQRVVNGPFLHSDGYASSSANYYSGSGHAQMTYTATDNMPGVEMSHMSISTSGRCSNPPSGTFYAPILSPDKQVQKKSSLYDISRDFVRDRKNPLARVESLAGKYNSSTLTRCRFYVMSFVIASCLILLLIWNISPDFPTFVICTSIHLSCCAMVYSMWILAWILKYDQGTGEMQEIGDAIREGSEGFFAVQYGTILRISCIFTIIIFTLYAFRPNTETYSSEIGNWTLAFITAFTFLVGALCSALSGYSGMWVSVRANVRVASASRTCYNEALQICFRGGAFSSVINVALAIIGISTIFLLIRIFLPGVPFVQTPLLLVGYGFGASLVAMFAQLGGGIFTKGADVGADLIGKIEAGIPEDDPRNPAVIADLVGDNVGDCAGQCADLFESITAEIISAMILGGALAQEAKFPARTAAGFVLFPLAVHCMDLFISSIGVLLVRTNTGLPPDATSDAATDCDPLSIMIRVYLITCTLGVIGFTGLCRYFLFVEAAPLAWRYYAVCGVIGMACAFFFVIITQYYTDYHYAPVKKIAEASLTGPATNIIAGLAVGLESTALPVLCISAAIASSYHLGMNSGVSAGDNHMAGLFGTAVATMGMLCTAVFVLSMSSFGPIADNAGGIVEMSLHDEHVRAITDRLDAVGNVTKANTKGFSVGSAALACFLLFTAFMDEVSVYSKQKFSMVDIAVPEVFVGGIIGAMTVFVFSAWALEAVGRAAQQVVKEVRRQFLENPTIMDFQMRPDYHACVSIVSRTALKEMVKPGLLAVLSPIVVGIVFRIVGVYQRKPLLGAEVVAGYLIFSTMAGILMALFMNNSGGAWDNAKKYIETGALGGKGSATHKAAVVGDTVGDPCKDTAGPSVHVLIKLVSTVTLVLTPLFVTKGENGVLAA